MHGHVRNNLSVLCLKNVSACLFILRLGGSDCTVCASVCALMYLSAPCMSINVMLQWQGACAMKDQTLENEASLGSHAVWKKMHVTSSSAILHSTALLLSFILPSLFFHLHFYYFLFFFYLFSFPFLCLSPFLFPSITHSIISPLL